MFAICPRAEANDLLEGRKERTLKMSTNTENMVCKRARSATDCAMMKLTEKMTETEALDVVEEMIITFAKTNGDLIAEPLLTKYWLPTVMELTNRTDVRFVTDPATDNKGKLRDILARRRGHFKRLYEALIGQRTIYLNEDLYRKSVKCEAILVEGMLELLEGAHADKTSILAAWEYIFAGITRDGESDFEKMVRESLARVSPETALTIIKSFKTKTRVGVHHWDLKDKVVTFLLIGMFRQLTAEQKIDLATVICSVVGMDSETVKIVADESERAGKLSLQAKALRRAVVQLYFLDKKIEIVYSNKTNLLLKISLDGKFLPDYSVSMVMHAEAVMDKLGLIKTNIRKWRTDFFFPSESTVYLTLFVPGFPDGKDPFIYQHL